MNFISSRFLIAVLLCFLMISGTVRGSDTDVQPDRYLIIISIDGFPADALWNIEAPIPFIRSMALNGAWAQAMIPSNPTVTWPNHTSLVTGVHPEKHSLLFNAKILRPEKGRIPVSRDGRKDKADLVAIPTLYDIAYYAGLRTAEVNWPGTRNASTLHDSFPDTPDNVTHITPRLRNELIELGILDDDTPSALWRHSPVGRDLVWTQTANHLIRTRKPNVLLLHLLNVDGTHHRYGVNTNPGYTALGLADAHVKMLVETLKHEGIYDQTTIFIVSDHGFINTEKTVFPNVILQNHNLLEVDEEGLFISGRAQAQTLGGSAMIYLDNPNDEDLQQEIIRIFSGTEGIYKVIEPADYPAYGLPLPKINEQMGDLFIAAESGYALNGSMRAPQSMVNTLEYGLTYGHHGFLTDHKQMETLFVAYGKGIKKSVVLDTVDNRSVAPTAAKLLGLEFDTADGAILEEILK